MQKDRLFIYLDSADDFDSYMVKMEDVVDNFSLDDGNSVFDDAVKDAYSADKFNFLINFFSYMKYDLKILGAKKCSAEDRFDVLKAASAFAYQDLFLGRFPKESIDSDLASGAASIISADIFAENFVFSDFSLSSGDTWSTHYDLVTTISGLNSYFESNSALYEYLDSGWIDMFDHSPMDLKSEILTEAWRETNALEYFYLKEFSEVLKRVFYEGYFDTNVPLPVAEESRDAFSYVKTYPSVFDTNSIFYLVTGRNNSYFSHQPSARYHPTDAALFLYKGRTFNNYLEVDNALVLPYGVNIKLSITGDDVIHS
eukprot:TRINITY_DN1103_c0_g1_i16.p1 TRINITY_DN1103_c0_g1~~TRINITY_DN1103_c0_g1_i16.p1  ORF type:complete len:313 (-),score=9.32 TRINITY_DN1103_c0_g1_i16:1263-2201(-)